MKDYYAILGINEYSRSDEIKSAYRALVKIWHPDRCSQGDAEARFVEICEAYEVLSNERKRKEYDDIRNYETPIQAESFVDMSLGTQLFTAFKRTFLLVFVIVCIIFISFIAFDVYHKINENTTGQYDVQTSR